MPRVATMTAQASSIQRERLVEPEVDFEVVLLPDSRPRIPGLMSLIVVSVVFMVGLSFLPDLSPDVWFPT